MSLSQFPSLHIGAGIPSWLGFMRLTVTTTIYCVNDEVLSKFCWERRRTVGFGYPCVFLLVIPQMQGSEGSLLGSFLMVYVFRARAWDMR